jgi:nickel-dependent lactate racemase
MAEKNITVDIPLGSTVQQARIPDAQFAGTYLPRKMSVPRDPDGMLRQSIQDGMEHNGLGDRIRPGAKACIVITDRTRPTPNHLILPILLDTLNGYGIRDRDITVLVGVAMHAPDSLEAIRQNVGKAVADRVEIINSEPDNESAMVFIGKTSFGTPVEVHRRFAEAEIKIGTGNVTPCMLAGWSGGGKIVIPGVASRCTIYENHKLFTGILAELGRGSLMGIMPPHNVVRADIEEAATMSGVDMVVNTVLDSKRRLFAVYSGHHVLVHRSAIDVLRPYVEVSVPQKVDVMIVGVGEIDYEVSLFQGGSRVCGGVDRFLNDGGTLIMSNDCREGIYEGFEHEEFREWMRQMPTPAELRERTEAMEIGGEKGCVLHTFSWLIHQKKCRIITVTENMTKEELKEIHLDHASHVQHAVDEALGCYQNGASVAAIPFGALVLPKS